MSRKWIIKKAKISEPLGTDGEQVYSDKFTEYDKVTYLAQWLNKHSPNWNYWTEEVEVEKEKENERSQSGYL